MFSVLQTGPFVKHSLRKLRSLFTLVSRCAQEQLWFYCNWYSKAWQRSQTEGIEILDMEPDWLADSEIEILCSVGLIMSATAVKRSKRGILSSSHDVTTFQSIVTRPMGHTSFSHTHRKLKLDYLTCTIRVLSYNLSPAHPEALAVALHSERHASEILTWLANLKLWYYYCGLI